MARQDGITMIFYAQWLPDLDSRMGSQLAEWTRREK
jgi:hypothetical protein